jgi:hypothetical protein
MLDPDPYQMNTDRNTDLFNEERFTALDSLYDTHLAPHAPTVGRDLYDPHLAPRDSSMIITLLMII